MSKSYVYENTEVVLTGRRAEREIAARSSRGKDRIDELVEIKPKDPEDGSWTKFVRESEMYVIKEEE